MAARSSAPKLLLELGVEWVLANDAYHQRSTRVTEGVEGQGGEMSSLGAEVERLIALARGTPCPDRERVLAYLADLELLETSQRLRATAAKRAAS